MRQPSSKWAWSFRAPPILVQVFGLAFGTLVVAQIVALLLSVIFAPVPRRYAMEDIAAALRQADGPGGSTIFDRNIQSGPPDFSARGWFVSPGARARLAHMVGRPINEIALGFYTQLPVGGTVEPLPPARELPADAAQIPTAAHDAGIGVRTTLAVVGSGGPDRSALHPAALFVMTDDLPRLGASGLMTIQMQAPGGMPQGPPAMPGGGFPGGTMGEGASGSAVFGRDRGGFGLPRDRAPLPRGQSEPSASGPSTTRSDGMPGRRPHGDVIWGEAVSRSPAAEPHVYGPTDRAMGRGVPGQGGSPDNRDGMLNEAGAGRLPEGRGGIADRQRASDTMVPFDPWPNQSISRWPKAPETPSKAVRIAPLGEAAAGRSEEAIAPSLSLPLRGGTKVVPQIEAPVDTTPLEATTRRPTTPGSDMPIGTPVPIERLSRGVESWSPTPFVEGDFIAAIRQADGRWMTVAPRAEGFPNSWQRRLALWFLLSLLIVAPIAWAFARRIVGPLNAFARTADMLGRDPGAAVLPLDGPAEIGRAAHAFNQMQSRLRSFVDDRTAMIGAISHDLRTPLTRLRFRIEDVPDDQRDDLLDEVIEMEEMISSVLAFMRDASIPNARERRDLAELVEDVVEDAALIGDVRTVGVEPAIVDIDALGMRRVLNNLMTNALKYGGGRARVALHVEDDQVMADIIDQGPGIPPAEVERAFEPFYRTASAQASGREGSGPGLAVCRSIARAHGGDVELFHSPSGFIARVRLPLAYGLETRAA